MLIEFQTLEPSLKSFGSFSKNWWKSLRMNHFWVGVCELWEIYFKIIGKKIFSVCKCVLKIETIESSIDSQMDSRIDSWEENTSEWLKV
jgi:hypothetical protein